MTGRSNAALANAIRQHARAAMKDLALPRIYLITAYDGNGHVKVNVEIDPSQPQIESNWMPLGCIGVGNGWGVLVGPQIGDQVLCVFENGDFSSGVVVARLFSTQAQPIPVPSGEIWSVHSTGSFVKLTNDGKVTVQDKYGSNVVLNGDGTATVNASQGLTVNAAAGVTVNASAGVTLNAASGGATVNGNVQVNGNLQASGSIADVNAAHGTMAQLRTDYDTHNHQVQNVQGGTGTIITSAPNLTL